MGLKSKLYFTSFTADDVTFSSSTRPQPLRWGYYLLLYSCSILQIKFLNKLNQLGLENMIKDKVRDCIENY